MKAPVGFTAFLICSMLTLPIEGSPTLEWIDQIVSRHSLIVEDVSADGLGNIYITGWREGPSNAFLTKFNDAGNHLWTEWLDTEKYALGFGVSADGLGNIYIAGNLSGYPFVSKYSSSGDLAWTETIDNKSPGDGYDVITDGRGNVYLSGFTTGDLAGSNAGGKDAFLAKFDETGKHHWTNQFGTKNDDEGFGVAADYQGNVFISGTVFGKIGETHIGGLDSFIGKYDENGDLLWIKQHGTSSNDESYGVATDKSGNVYITGYAFGNLSGKPYPGSGDAYVSKFDPNGTLLWTEQIGSNSPDYSYSISIDNYGNTYISGYTNGNMASNNAGSNDSFISKINPSGIHVWTEQLGSSESDTARGVATDGLGNIYLAGHTYGIIEGHLDGTGADAFIAKFSDPIPEPSSLLLGIIGSTTLLRRRRRT